MTPANAKNYVPNKETLQPATSGNNVSGHSYSHLFCITDHSFGLKFLQTPEPKLILSCPHLPERSTVMKCRFHLQVVNSSPIAAYGGQLLTLDLELHRTFQLVFIIVDVQNPILRANFLDFWLIYDILQV